MAIVWGEFETRPAFRLFAVVLFFSFLTSCGGGDSDEGGSDGGDPPAGAVISTNVFTNEPYDNSELSVDPTTGQTIVRTRLSILFNPTATPEQVNNLLSRINASITAAIAGSRSAGIRIPDPVTVAALDAIIVDIESETFVEAVMKAALFQTDALPDNVSEENMADLEIIDNHLAVGGPAAWNAKEAITTIPHVIMIDRWGDGTEQFSFLDTTFVSGFIQDGEPDAVDHGYHVAGILNGSFGGGSTPSDLVTGMFPGQTYMHFIDLTSSIPPYDAGVEALRIAAAIGGTVVLNTSVGYPCDIITTTGSCNETETMKNAAITWVLQMRALGMDMESQVFQTTTAGNREPPRPEARDAATRSHFSAAATMTNMSTADGIQVPALTNTMVVENLSGTDHPRKIECLHDNSFIGGNISAIGTEVTSLATSGTAKLSGTSMASPQVAGLAAYLLAIDPSLSPQKIKEILLATAQVVPGAGGADCSDATAAPAIDAYAAVLALDKASALNGTRSDAPVRNAILDISNDGTTKGVNNRFDEDDLMYFIEKINKGTEESQTFQEVVRYSRADLNGDSYDGGRTGFERKFNLNIDYPPTFTTVTQTIEGDVVEFDENALTDNDILCYYAYSRLYTGNTTARTNLLGNRCEVSKVAVYHEHTNEIYFPPVFLNGCGNTSNDEFERRGNYDTRPRYSPSTIPITERPTAHFWQPGDSNVDLAALDSVSTRRAFDPAGAFNNCDYEETYHSVSANDSTVQLSQSGDSVEVDFTVSATSECVELPQADPDDEWTCSGAQTVSSFSADYDFKISASTNLNLNIDMSCSGPGLRLPGNSNATFGPEIGFYVIRLNSDGERIRMNRDARKLIVSLPVACYEDSPTVNIQQLIELDAPETPGDIDRVIIVAYGSIGAYGNWGNVVDPAPTLGELTNTSTMQGTVQLTPAN